MNLILSYVRCVPCLIDIKILRAPSLSVKYWNDEDLEE